MSIFALPLHQFKGILVPALHRGGLRSWEPGSTINDNSGLVTGKGNLVLFSFLLVCV